MDIDASNAVERLVALGYRREDIVVLPNGEVTIVEQNEFEGSARMLRKKRIGDLKNQINVIDLEMANFAPGNQSGWAQLQAKKDSLNQQLVTLLQKDGPG